MAVLLTVALIAFFAGWAFVVVHIAYDAFAPDPPPAPRPVQFKRSLLTHSQRSFVY